MNELTSQGVAFLEAGNESKAQELFIESLRQNIKDAETWFWLATTFKDSADRARCLRYVTQLIDPSNEIAQKGLVFLSQETGIVEYVNEDLKSVEVPVAGVDHRNRQTVIRGLEINARALLRREPYNPYDESAIRVETENGQQLGYVPRRVAFELSPYLDELQKLLSARVTGLTAGHYEDQSISVRVTFFIPKSWQLLSATHEQIEYSYDDTGSYTYILLNCNERALENVKSELQKCGIEVLHSGVSSRPASNGRLYQWFIRIGNESKEETVERVEYLFESTFGVLSNEAKIRRLEQERLDLDNSLKQAEIDRDRLVYESIEYLDKSEDLGDRIRQKDAEIESLKYQLDQKQDELDSQKRAEGIQETAMSEPFIEVVQIIECLLPDIEFLRDSIKVLLYKVQDRYQALRLLQKIRYSPETIKAEDFESAARFRELRFGREGRLYFRRDTGEPIRVLVSTKQSQREDERYLKKYA